MNDIDTNADDKTSFPEISAQLAMMHSPEELISILPHIELCEAGRDEFYDCYTAVLRPETDRRFTISISMRCHLQAVFTSILKMQLFSSGLVGNHEGTRIPGTVEHILYRCLSHDHIHEVNEDCSIETIEGLTTEVEKEIHTNAYDVERQKEDFKNARTQFLTELKRALLDLDELGRRYLCHQIITDLRRWLKLSIELR